MQYGDFGYVSFHFFGENLHREIDKKLERSEQKLNMMKGFEDGKRLLETKHFIVEIGNNALTSEE